MYWIKIQVFPWVATGSGHEYQNIRGLSEKPVCVTLIDGNRVETANDLTASMSMIDMYDVERV